MANSQYNNFFYIFAYMEIIQLSLFDDIPNICLSSTTENINIKKSLNTNLHKAKNVKNDEFYTKYEDIEKEVLCYKEQFKGKIVYCPCDDYRWSNFTKYFKENYKILGIKKLICTCFNIGNGAFKYTYDGNNEIIAKMEENGEFNSEESLSLLSECDIVVTNPPFSLFKKFIPLLDFYNKDFLVIGSENAFTYKEIFPLFMKNKMFVGSTKPKSFQITSNVITDPKKQYEENGKVYQRFGNICWFTTLINFNKKNIFLPLSKEYSENEHPMLENGNAIECGHLQNNSWKGFLSDIPYNYKGVMAVPITILENYNPEQFEIIGSPDANIVPEWWKGTSKKFAYIYNQQNHEEKYKEGSKATCFIDKDGIARVAFKRILIKNKKAF